MPIVYVHGVANRPGPVLDAALLQIETFARRYAAPAISNDPDGVAFIPVVWGDLGAQLAWAGASRPRSQLLGMGAGSGTSARLLTLAENYPALHEIPVEAPAAAAPASGGLIGGAEPLPAGSRPPVLRDLTPDELADVLAQAVTSVTTAPANGRAAPAGSSVTLALIAADDVAHDPTTHTALAAAPDLAAEVAAVESRFTERLATLEAEQGALIGMGGPGDWGRRLGDRLGEIATRGLSAPGWAASRVLLEARGPLNLMMSTFLGDIIVYLLQRGTATDPGPIPRRLLSGLRAARRASVDRGGEPIVLLTHSMGGQIAYDTLTTFLPAVDPNDADLADVRVDLWAATASQVPYFEELKLFLAPSSDYSAATGAKVPRPDRARLGIWWNVWDPNDVLSFTAAPIFEGVHDEMYDGGMSVAGAHGSYLARPGFYRRMGEILRGAAARGWDRP